MDSIRLATLGRDVCVGKPYDYFTDTIFPGDTEIPRESKSIERECSANAEIEFFFQHQPEKYKRLLLRINSHLYQSIERGNIDSKELWFSDYLKATTATDDDVAQVTVFFSVSCQTETLDEDFKSKVIVDGKPTHLVEQVVYGSEVICSMRKSFDWNRETKESAEESLYLAAKAYFEQAVGTNLMTADDVEPPIEFDNVSCTVFSSLEAGKVTNLSIEKVRQRLSDAIHGNLHKKLRPIEISLRPISVEIQNQILPQLLLEREIDIHFEKERNNTMWKWINDESRILLLSQPSLDRIPPYKTAMDEFRLLLEPLRNEIDKFYTTILSNKDNPYESIRNKTRRISSLLADVTDWLIRRRKEMEKVTYLLSGTQLAMHDIMEIESREISDTEKCAKVFILNVDYRKDSLMESIQKSIGIPKPEFKFPDFLVTLVEEDLFESINNMLQAFTYEARLSHCCSIDRNSYQIGLVPIASQMHDGAIKYIKYRSKDRAAELQDIQGWVPLLQPPPNCDLLQSAFDNSSEFEFPLPPPPPALLFETNPSDLSDLPPPPPPPPPVPSSAAMQFTPVPQDDHRNLLLQQIKKGKRLKPTQPRESDMATSSTQKESFNKRMNEVVKQQHDDAAQAQHRELFLQEIKQGIKLSGTKKYNTIGHGSSGHQANRPSILPDIDMMRALRVRLQAINPDPDTVSEAGSSARNDWDEKESNC